MRYVMLFSLIFLTSSALAQGVDDSVRFCTVANWNVVKSDNGLVVRELKSKSANQGPFLFGAPNHVYVMELDPKMYRIAPAQDLKKQNASSLCRSRGAVAAVNGGFFVVDARVKDTAVANDFLKIDGQVVSPIPSPGWGTAAVGIGSDYRLGFTQWNKQMERDTIKGWSAGYPNVMAAGPMIIMGGRDLVSWANVDKNSLSKEKKSSIYAPRTAIGVRADGTVVFLVVDGRRARAFGASIAELAVMGRWLGLSDMLNLDGGGSTTMFCNKTLVNFPSDFLGILPIERPVANAMLVFKH